LIDRCKNLKAECGYVMAKILISIYESTLWKDVSKIKR
jgi:hypothetical protein